MVSQEAASSEQSRRGPPEDTFTILLATDVHLGYGEKDPVKENDSFVTFEEILQIAVDKEVDFLLLGGDLFHENKPSRRCLQRCMDILRKYVYGDKPIEYEFLSDPKEIFKNSSANTVNFEDRNLNVGLPIFSIHGNHDDPAGLGQYCTLDLLSTAGLVNYFGKILSLKEINVVPLLFRKGKTNLAIYGLSAVKDDRLHRLFEESNVRLIRPKENEGDWFNLLTLHQNRVAHGYKNHIPESFLPKFLDLVFWGHEHESLVEAQWNSEREFLSLNQVKKLIQTAEKQKTNHPDQPTKPLIRLIVEYEHESHTTNSALFGRQFQDQVANPNDILKFKRVALKKESKEAILDSEAIEEAFENAPLNARVETLVEDYFKNSDKPLFELSERGLSEAVRLFTDKEDKDALETIVKLQMNKTLAYLKKNAGYIEDTSYDDMKNNIDALIEQFKNERKEKKGDDEDISELKNELANPQPSKQTRTRTNDDENDEDFEPMATPATSRSSARGRGRARADKTRSPRARGRGRGRGQDRVESDDEISIIDADDDDTAPSPAKRGGRGSRGGRAAARASAKRGASGNQSTIADAFSRQATQSRSGRTQVRNYTFEDSD